MLADKRTKIITYHILLIFAVLITVFLNHPYFKNSAEILGYPAYYVETENPTGFSIRAYYSKRISFKKDSRIMAFSYGYEIMDDVYDIDHDGNNELLCTCTGFNDDSVKLYVYKVEGQKILCGQFSPESIDAEDFYSYGDGSFITYYDPQDELMKAQYTTLTGSRYVELPFEQLQFSKFADLQECCN